MLPAFEIVHRLRPVALVAWERTTGFVAPYAAVEAELGTHDVAGRVVAGFRGPGGNASSQDSVPDKWSEKDNVLWKTKLPGLGTS